MTKLSTKLKTIEYPKCLKCFPTWNKAKVIYLTHLMIKKILSISKIAKVFKPGDIFFCCILPCPMIEATHMYRANTKYKLIWYIKNHINVPRKYWITHRQQRGAQKETWLHLFLPSRIKLITNDFYIKSESTWQLTEAHTTTIKTFISSQRRCSASVLDPWQC